MRILLALLFPCLIPLAAAEGPETRSSLDLAVEGYLDGRPLLAPAGGGVLGVFGAQVHAWFPSIDGDMSTGIGQTIDFDSDLNLESTDVTVMPELHVALLGFGLRLQAFFADFNGRNRINRSFTFSGITFNVNEQVTSEVSIDHYRLLMMRTLIRTRHVAFSLQTGVSVFSLQGRVSSSLTGSASESEDIYVPLIGALVQIRIKRLLIELDAAGFTIDYGDVSGTLIDLRGSVGFAVSKVIALRAGYRYLRIEGEAIGLSLDATLSGFFVGASIQF